MLVVVHHQQCARIDSPVAWTPRLVPTLQQRSVSLEIVSLGNYRRCYNVRRRWLVRGENGQDPPHRDSGRGRRATAIKGWRPSASAGPASRSRANRPSDGDINLRCSAGAGESTSRCARRQHVVSAGGRGGNQNRLLSLAREMNRYLGDVYWAKFRPGGGSSSTSPLAGREARRPRARLGRHATAGPVAPGGRPPRLR
jgi:hypothetical protein